MQAEGFERITESTGATGVAGDAGLSDSLHWLGTAATTANKSAIFQQVSNWHHPC
jgi:hypothetical protein